MADARPFGSDESAEGDADPRVVGLDSEAADELMDALSSGTARSVLSTLHDDPSTPSEVAERVDTSLQNAQYHLGKLEDAGIIEVVDTVYSQKGREMQVYAPTDGPLVVFAGDEEETGGLRSALARLLGGVGVLALASLLVQRVFGGPLLGSPGGSGDPAGATTGTTAGAGGGPSIMDATTTATETATTAAGGAGGAGGLPPGLLFFLGGASVLVAALGVWVLRAR